MRAAAEKITAMDLLDVLDTAGALETFNRLPQADQENFKSWIGRARNNISHWRRIDALVLAMITGPLQSNRTQSEELDEGV